MTTETITLLETYIAIANDTISKKMVDPAGQADPDLIEFWAAHVYWELQLYAFVQLGIADLWRHIQSKPGKLDQAVLNTYSEFRARAGLNAAKWKELVDLLSHSLSLRCNTSTDWRSASDTDVTAAVNSDTYSRSTDPSALASLLNNNAWLVPIILFKMGPAPIEPKKKSRGQTSL